MLVQIQGLFWAAEKTFQKANIQDYKMWRIELKES